MGGINIDWNPGADRKYKEAVAYRQQKDEEEKRQKREDDARALFTQLLDKGAQPDVAEQAASRFLQTGRIDLPEFQTKNLPGTNMFPEGIPVREPMRFRNRKALYSQDDQGKFTEQSIPSDVDSFQVEKVHSTAKVGSKSGGGESPDLSLMKDTVKKVAM